MCPGTRPLNVKPAGFFHVAQVREILGIQDEEEVKAPSAFGGSGIGWDTGGVGFMGIYSPQN